MTDTLPAGAGAAELAELAERREWALRLGGLDRIERQHARGRMTARERCLALVDPGSWFESGMLAHSGDAARRDRTAGDGRLVGWGKINGRLVAVEAGDATVLGGSNGPEAARRKAIRIHESAVERGYPLIMLSEGGGGRVEGLMGWAIGSGAGSHPAHGGHGPSQDCRYRVPFVTAVLGSAYGSAAFRVGVSDYAVMSRGSNVSISSPGLVKTATGEVVSEDELGGVDVHTKVTGLIDGVGETEFETLQLVRAFIDYMPLSATKPLPIHAGGDPVTRQSETLRSIVPERPNRAFDMRKIIREVADDHAFLEIKPEYGRPVILGLARVGGIPVGVLGSNSAHKAGAIDVDAAQKMAKFIGMCSTFGLPLVFFHDVPGVLIGKAAEHQGIIKHVLAVMTEIGNLRVPRISIIVRKSYGLAYLAMGASFMKGTFTYAWPSARLGFMAPDAGVRIAFGRELAESGLDEAALGDRYADLLTKWEQDGLPWDAAGNAYIDDVIDPAETREVIYRAIEVGLGQGV